MFQTNPANLVMIHGRAGETEDNLVDNLENHSENSSTSNTEVETASDEANQKLEPGAPVQ